MSTRAGAALGLQATILAGGSGAVVAQGGWAAGSPAAWVAGWAAAWVERVACFNRPSGVVPHLFLIEYDEIAVRNSRVGATYGYRCCNASVRDGGHMGVDVVTDPDDWVDRHGDNLHL
jgi:hypothetical protein